VIGKPDAAIAIKAMPKKNSHPVAPHSTVMTVVRQGATVDAKRGAKRLRGEKIKWSIVPA
jgi:hypothetical protein